MLGNADVVIAGGMESMTNTPYYLPKQRFGSVYGNTEVVDGVVKDGLYDIYNDYLMGVAAEECATEYGITREQQDDFAIESYKRSQAAHAAGLYKDEIVPVVVSGGRGKPDRVIEQDDEMLKLNEEKLRAVRPAFAGKEGTVTAPNSSPLSDGATAIVLCSKVAADKYGLPLLAKIKGWGDAAQAPARFTTSPALALPKAIKHAGLQPEDIEYYEINEAFSVVACANSKILKLNKEHVNIWGGAVAMGHPLGCSGARIIATLTSVLKHKQAKYGAAAICNGGGGASAIVIERSTFRRANDVAKLRYLCQSLPVATKHDESVCRQTFADSTEVRSSTRLPTVITMGCSTRTTLPNHLRSGKVEKTIVDCKGEYHALELFRETNGRIERAMLSKPIVLSSNSTADESLQGTQKRLVAKHSK
ncbi:acetyl- acetyltransferase protein [Mucor ambiguus]|uniref:acetyl-CoA C-acetyltransferase n=1 Tax=Mucor ambiguus TaxID=91626 RepID=A0A0C9LYR9_9FUNG|nr:acetyl- acetyltransferase protein [Mucor ambiguus]